MIVEPTQTEARAVERAGRYLARELPQVLIVPAKKPP